MCVKASKNFYSQKFKKYKYGKQNIINVDTSKKILRDMQIGIKV